MNQILTLLMQAISKDKGRDANRTLVLVGVAWLCWQMTVLDKRVAVIELAHAPRPVHVARAETNHLAGRVEKSPPRL